MGQTAGVDVLDDRIDLGTLQLLVVHLLADGPDALGCGREVGVDGVAVLDAQPLDYLVGEEDDAPLDEMLRALGDDGDLPALGHEADTLVVLDAEFDAVGRVEDAYG